MLSSVSMVSIAVRPCKFLKHISKTRFPSCNHKGHCQELEELLVDDPHLTGRQLKHRPAFRLLPKKVQKVTQRFEERCIDKKEKTALFNGIPLLNGPQNYKK